jgi:hypothetical protein
MPQWARIVVQAVADGIEVAELAAKASDGAGEGLHKSRRVYLANKNR